MIIFRKFIEEVQVTLQCDNNNGTSHEDQFSFFIISRSFLLRMRNVSTKIVEKIKTHILSSITFFFENLTVYEIKLKTIVERERQQMIIQRMLIACWIRQSTNYYLEYVLFIVFLLQPWLYESASTLRYTVHLPVLLYMV